MSRFPLINLLGKIVGEIFIAQFIVYASIGLICIFIYHMMKKPPEIKYVEIESTKNTTSTKASVDKEQPSISEFKILHENPDITSYPSVQIASQLQTSDDYITIDTLTSSIRKQIDTFNITNMNGNTGLEQYLNGSKDMAVNIKQRLESIEKPIWSIWNTDIDIVLDDLDLTESISEDDLKQLYQMAQSELYIDDQTVSISIQDFVKESLSYINPEKYELFQIDTTIEIKYDLEIGELYNDVEFITNMNQYKGRIANINSIHRNEDNNTTYYRIDIDHEKHQWTRDMFNVL